MGFSWIFILIIKYFVMCLRDFHVTIIVILAHILMWFKCPFCSKWMETTTILVAITFWCYSLQHPNCFFTARWCHFLPSVITARIPLFSRSEFCLEMYYWFSSFPLKSKNKSLKAIILFISDFFQFFGPEAKCIYFHLYWPMKGLIFVTLSGCFFPIFSLSSAKKKLCMIHWLCSSYDSY